MYQTKSIYVLLREQNSTYSIFKLTQTSHPYWKNCTTLCHGRCLCCHIISSTTVKLIPSLSQEVVTYSRVCWLYCVSSRPLVLSTNKREGRARFCMIESIKIISSFLWEIRIFTKNINNYCIRLSRIIMLKERGTYSHVGENWNINLFTVSHFMRDFSVSCWIFQFTEIHDHSIQIKHN